MAALVVVSGCSSRVLTARSHASKDSSTEVDMSLRLSRHFPPDRWRVRGDESQIDIRLDYADQNDLEIVACLVKERESGKDYRLALRQSTIDDLSPLAGIPVHSLFVEDRRIPFPHPIRGTDALCPNTLKHLSVNAWVNDIATLGVYTNLARLFIGHSPESNDLRPLSRLKLKHLYVSATSVSDLSALKDMPLERLTISMSPVTNLAALSRSKLQWVDLSRTHVRCLAPLTEEPIETLNISHTSVTDLSSLSNMPIASLDITGTCVSDIAPIARPPLAFLCFTPENIVNGLELLKDIPNLTLSTDGRYSYADKIWTAEEIWKNNAQKFPWRYASADSVAKDHRDMPRPGENWKLPLLNLKMIWIQEGILIEVDAERDGGENADAIYETFAASDNLATARRIAKGFWMGQTTVTKGMFRNFIERTEYRTTAEQNGFAFVFNSLSNKWRMAENANWLEPGFAQDDNHPAVCITWLDAKFFCEWLSKTEWERGALPRGYEYRLPTEIEWEYSASGGRTRTLYWWGNRLIDGRGRFNGAGTDRLPNGSQWPEHYDWEDEFSFTSPVDYYGKSGRNSFGLADMLGNVYQWCFDGYRYPHTHVHAGEIIRRMRRGGSYRTRPSDLSCAYRAPVEAYMSFSDTGFRIVLAPMWGSKPFYDIYMKR